MQCHGHLVASLRPAAAVATCRRWCISIRPITISLKVQEPLQVTRRGVFGLVSNSGEGMDVCKCIVPSRHGGTLNGRRVACPLVRLVAGEERWEAPDRSKVLSLKIEVESTKIVLSPA
ncbi:hypothetical protein TNCV_690461 [Trichonephila clavipes]|nr:hypothetical protein TNCV_690461 [Trichonephila clavipes]